MRKTAHQRSRAGRTATERVIRSTPALSALRKRLGVAAPSFTFRSVSFHANGDRRGVWMEFDPPEPFQPDALEIIARFMAFPIELARVGRNGTWACRMFLTRHTLQRTGDAAVALFRAYEGGGESSEEAAKAG